MKKSVKISLILACSLILIGCILFGGAMTAMKWDFNKLSTERYETREHTVTESFTDIRVAAKTADIRFVLSEEDTVSVTCHEHGKNLHTVTVEGDTLVIQNEDTRAWYEQLGIVSGSPSVTVRLPRGEYGALGIAISTGDVSLPAELVFRSIDISGSTGDITCLSSAIDHVKVKTTTGKITGNAFAAERIDLKTTTGGISVENLYADGIALSVTTGRVRATGVQCEGDISLTVSTGRAELTDVTCRDLFTDGNTGALTLTRVLATGKLSIERSTGDVCFTACDAAEIYVRTDTGDVTGSLCSDKIFFVETDTGRREYPKTTTGGRCEITTDTGDVRITVVP